MSNQAGDMTFATASDSRTVQVEAVEMEQPEMDAGYAGFLRETNGNPWKLMDIHGDWWKSMEIHGNHDPLHGESFWEAPVIAIHAELSGDKGYPKFHISVR